MNKTAIIPNAYTYISIGEETTVPPEPDPPVPRHQGLVVPVRSPMIVQKEK
jgi:hypothetical protein